MKDSDADLPQVGSTSLPRAASKQRSRSKSKQQKKDRSKSPKRSKTPPRSRSRPVSPIGLRALPGQAGLVGFTPGIDPSPVYFTSHSPLPTNLSDKNWKQEFLQWTLDDCRLSWKTKKVSWRGSTFTCGCTSTPLHPNIQSTIFGAWRLAASARILLYLLDSVVGLVVNQGREVL